MCIICIGCPAISVTVSIADAAHVVEADCFSVESDNRVPKKFETADGLDITLKEFFSGPEFETLEQEIQ